MLGCLAYKALIFGRMRSVSRCLSLCLGSMAMGLCSQHVYDVIEDCKLQLRKLHIDDIILRKKVF